MKRIITLAVIALAFCATGFTRIGSWVIDEESQLTIQGSTNVNAFTCKIEHYGGTDTLHYLENNSAHELHFIRTRMTVPIRSFDCGAKHISKDFRKTLKAESHPNLEISFVSLKTLDFKDKSDIKGVVDITLAGVTARYTICYQVSVKPNGKVLLTGIQAVSFSDFQLTAPEKLKGLIKVNEGLKVEFNLVLKEV